MATEFAEETRAESDEWKERIVRSIPRSPREAEAPEKPDAKKAAFLRRLTSLLQRGRITPEDLAGALRASRNAEPGRPVRPVGSRLRDLRIELAFERAANEFLEGEVTRLRAALEQERGCVRGGLDRIAALEWRIAEGTDATERLVVASRDSLRGLQLVSRYLADDGADSSLLDPLNDGLCDVAKTALELHALARPGGGAKPAALDER